MTGRTSPSERLYATLRAAILGGAFAPEQALKPQELADAERVSLAVARETLLRLVGEGLATRLPNRGFAVPAVNAEHWQHIAEARPSPSRPCCGWPSRAAASTGRSGSGPPTTIFPGRR